MSLVSEEFVRHLEATLETTEEALALAMRSLQEAAEVSAARAALLVEAVRALRSWNEKDKLAERIQAHLDEEWAG